MWKSKEKEIPLLEALANAQWELQPDWYGTAPFLVQIENQLIPLRPDFYEQTWILCVLDPTDVSFTHSLQLLQLWYYRYHSHALNFLVLFCLPYEYLDTKDNIEQWRRLLVDICPFVVDRKKELIKAVGEFPPPFFSFILNGKKVFEASEFSQISQMELAIQRTLRKKDPGLPLSPVWDNSQKKPSLRIELGSQPLVPSSNSNFFDQLLWVGHWERTSESIQTQEALAQLKWKALSPSSLYVIASSQKMQWIEVRLDGRPLCEQIAGKHIFFESDGRSYLKVSEPRAYSVLENVTQPEVEIIFILTLPVLTSFFSLRF